MHTGRLQAVHFLFMLLVGLRDHGLVADETEPACTWRTYLLQPEIGKRWRDPATVAQRQANLALQVRNWQR